MFHKSKFQTSSEPEVNAFLRANKFVTSVIFLKIIALNFEMI